jgi:hypothetical protein
MKAAQLFPYPAMNMFDGWAEGPGLGYGGPTSFEEQVIS